MGTLKTTGKIVAAPFVGGAKAIAWVSKKSWEGNKPVIYGQNIIGGSIGYNLAQSLSSGAAYSADALGALVYTALDVAGRTSERVKKGLFNRMVKGAGTLYFGTKSAVDLVSVLSGNFGDLPHLALDGTMAWISGKDTFENYAEDSGNDALTDIQRVGRPLKPGYEWGRDKLVVPAYRKTRDGLVIPLVNKTGEKVANEYKKVREGVSNWREGRRARRLEEEVEENIPYDADLNIPEPEDSSGDESGGRFRRFGRSLGSKLKGSFSRRRDYDESAGDGFPIENEPEQDYPDDDDDPNYRRVVDIIGDGVKSLRNKFSRHKTSAPEEMDSFYSGTPDFSHAEDAQFEDVSSVDLDYHVDQNPTTVINRDTLEDVHSIEEPVDEPPAQNYSEEVPRKHGVLSAEEIDSLLNNAEVPPKNDDSCRGSSSSEVPSNAAKKGGFLKRFMRKRSNPDRFKPGNLTQEDIDKGRRG